MFEKTKFRKVYFLKFVLFSYIVKFLLYMNVYVYVPKSILNFLLQFVEFMIKF